MKIALISDLHLGSWSYHHQRSPLKIYNDIVDSITGVDYIVIAGDFYNDVTQIDPRCMTATNANGIRIYRVLGNHDYYKAKTSDIEVMSLMRPLDWNGIDVLAGTYWTNFWGYPDHQADYVFRGIMDFYETGLKHTDLIRMNHIARLEIKDMQPEVIITHFPPSRKSIAERYEKSSSNSYFTNDDDELISFNHTKLWVFGHVHHTHSYYIGNCLCACNPLGYYGENYLDYKEYEPMIIEKVKGKYIVSAS